jgi:hypothetical protein
MRKPDSPCCGRGRPSKGAGEGGTSAAATPSIITLLAGEPSYLADPTGRRWYDMVHQERAYTSAIWYSP